MTTAASDDPVTTVKVPRSLRTQIARHAAATGQTAAGFLSTVVNRWERDQRLADVRRAYEHRDNAYDEETRAWDATDRDGLDV
jgi:hypothetical protein